MNEKEKAAYKKSKKKAEEILREPSKLDPVMEKAEKKAAKKPSRLRLVWRRFMALMRMIRAWRKGRYTRLPWRTLVMGTAAILYFLNPFDLIFDFIPFVGFIDDATVIAFVLGAISKDIDTFEKWEKKNGVYEIPSA